MISISTSYDYTVAIEKQVKHIAEAEFSHISLGGNLSHFNFLDHEKRMWFLKLTKNYRLKIDTVPGTDAPRGR